MSTHKAIYQFLFLAIVMSSFSACPPIRDVPYELTNPVVYAFYINKSEVRFDTLTTLPDRKYLEKHLPNYTWIGDSILLCRDYAFLYTEEQENARFNSDKVRLQQKIIRWKADRNRFVNQQGIFNLPRPQSTHTIIPISTPKVSGIVALVDSLTVTTSSFDQRETFQFKDAFLDGKYILWYDSIRIKKRGQFKKGLEVGEWISYDSLGAVMQIDYYDAGELQSFKRYDADKNFEIIKPYTKSRILFLHIAISVIFTGLLFISFFYYKKWYAPISKSEELDNSLLVVKVIRHIGLVILFSISMPFIIFFIQFAIASILQLFKWDLNLGLEYIVFMPLGVIAFSFFYFLITRRFKDYVWLACWLSIGLLLYGEFNFISSLLSI